VFVASPPSDVHIPSFEYAPATPGEFKNVLPRASELTALAQALKDLAAFKGYQQMLGTTAPTYAEVVQALTIGAQWTSTRQVASRWDGYCVVQEGIAWRAIRLIMAELVPLFTLAAKANPKLLTQYPGLASLLGAKKAIAAKAVSTKRANKQAKAEGKPPVHGAVGKRNQRKAEKAALAATQQGTGAAGAPAAPPVVQQAAASPAPAAATPTNGAAGGGGTHS
jgi:hypothetical protein